MTKITDLKYNAVKYDFNTGKLETFNVFGNISVLHSIAIWKTRDEKFRKNIDNPTMFFFSAYWSRCQYEFLVSEFVGKEDQEPEKVDVFKMYIKPNETLLLDMINDVSVNSCRKWLTEYNKLYRRPRTKK